MQAVALIEPDIRAATAGKATPAEQLQAARRPDNFAPRAFIKGDPVRLYCTNAQPRLRYAFA